MAGGRRLRRLVRQHLEREVRDAAEVVAQELMAMLILVGCRYEYKGSCKSIVSMLCIY